MKISNADPAHHREVERLNRTAEENEACEHNHTQCYNLDEEDEDAAGIDAKPKNRPTGSGTPALSQANSEGSDHPRGKDCDAEAEIEDVLLLLHSEFGVLPSRKQLQPHPGVPSVPTLGSLRSNLPPVWQTWKTGTILKSWI